MQNVTVKITLELEDSEGNQLSVAPIQMNGLDEERVLIVEGHFIAMLESMRFESLEYVQAELAGKGKRK